MTEGNRYEEAELIAAFERLFPQGFAGADVIAELAPKGWPQSPLYPLYHPSAETQYEEALRMHQNLGSLRKPDDDHPAPPAPNREDYTDEEGESLVSVPEEIGRLVGLALWDIFSDNHEVKDDDDRVLDTGSFRASGGFLADRVNAQIAAGHFPGPSQAQLEHDAMMEEELKKLMPPGEGMEMFLKMMKAEQTGYYKYTDFYMGTGMIASRADLTPVYVMIFKRLKKQGYDWDYHFPRLALVDFRPMKEAMDAKKREEDGEPEWAGYDPEAAFEKETADAEKDRELAEMREKLDDGYRDSVEHALTQPPPTVVSAYEFVYGDYPNGWPPESHED